MQKSAATLDSPLTALSGVGPALEEKLARLDLHRVSDLLFLLPNRYEDRTSLVKIGSLKAGDRCLVSGEVLLAEVVYRGRRNLLVRIGDGSGQLTLRFFHFSRNQQSQFRTGAILNCFGDARISPAGLEMVHPEYRARSRLGLKRFSYADLSKYRRCPAGTAQKPRQTGIGNSEIFSAEGIVAG